MGILYIRIYNIRRSMDVPFPYDRLWEDRDEEWVPSWVGRTFLMRKKDSS